jgi:hypothetical protein
MEHKNIRGIDTPQILRIVQAKHKMTMLPAA